MVVAGMTLIWALGWAQMGIPWQCSANCLVTTATELRLSGKRFSWEVM